MSSSCNESSVHQPEDSNRGNINSNQIGQISIRSPNLRDYFVRNEEIRNKGYIDSMKM